MYSVKRMKHLDTPCGRNAVRILKASVIVHINYCVQSVNRSGFLMYTAFFCEVETEF
jgi:hypothetical protein